MQMAKRSPYTPATHKLVPIADDSEATTKRNESIDELCEKMLLLGAFSKGTSDMTGAEVVERLLPFFGQETIDKALMNTRGELDQSIAVTIKADNPLGIKPASDYYGVYIVRPADQEFWKIKCPCGIEVTYPINELPLVDTLHPCGDHKHWTVKISDE